jgi:LysR family glycine cleavage system transcriptional activator
MSERSPPLLWVRVFEAAARHGSFLSAAKELSVSAAAVSRTIKELERSIGVRLFIRGARGVELTDAARTYAQALAPALRQIASASAQIRAAAPDNSVRVTAMPVLAQRWLLPRLGAFKELHPEVTVRVAADSAVLDPTRGEFDVALRYGEDRPAGCEFIDLFGEELTPVLSPKLASTLNLRVPEDCFRLTALYDTYWESDWSDWLATLGLQTPRRWRGLYFTLYTMAVDAAIAGYGVLIGHTAFIKDELKSGALVAPFISRLVPPKRYYALVQTHRASSPAVRAFVHWLSNCAGQGAGILRSRVDARRLIEIPHRDAIARGITGRSDYGACRSPGSGRLRYAAR